MASLVERFNHGAFSFIGEKFVALDREQVVDLFRNRAIGGIKRCQRIGRPGLLARDGGVGRWGRGALWRGRSFARFRCCLARRGRSNRQCSCTRRGRSFRTLSRRLTRCCHPAGFRECSRGCRRCARVLRNGPDRCCKDQRQSRARQDALITGVAHSAILPIPEYPQARPSSIPPAAIQMRSLPGFAHVAIHCAGIWTILARCHFLTSRAAMFFSTGVTGLQRISRACAGLRPAILRQTRETSGAQPPRGAHSRAAGLNGVRLRKPCSVGSPVPFDRR